MVSALVADLAQTSSGMDFIYRVLGRLCRIYALDDVAVVIDDPSIGRQIFRCGRRRLDAEGPLALRLDAGAGVQAWPDVVGAEVAGTVTHLCQLAIQLDIRRHDASHDALTGLFNRRSFDGMLRMSASRSARYGWPFALALVDLDRFKQVNDNMGHDEGDRVLRMIGAELRSTLRAGDIAARVGGDEFALILSNGAPDVVAGLLDRLKRAVGGDMGVEVGFSVGVALAPRDGSDPLALYRTADARLYESKTG